MGSLYHRAEEILNNVYLWFDKVTGGDEVERRIEEREDEGEGEQQEMEQMDNYCLSRGRNIRADDHELEIARH